MLIALRMRVGRASRLGLPVKAVGSEKDLRKGASRDRFEGRSRGEYEFFGSLVELSGCPSETLSEPSLSVISSRMNCVVAEGRNSAFVDCGLVAVLCTVSNSNGRVRSLRTH